MRLYLVRGDLAFTLLQPVPEGSWRWRGGVPVSPPWEEQELTDPTTTADEFLPVDCLAMNTGFDGFILSEFARAKLHPLLAPLGEFWPVRVFGYRYWWFNCLSCIEALDRQRTDADWSAVEGDWGTFHWITTTRRLAFRSSRLTMHPAVFRVPEYPQGILFSGEAFNEAVRTHDLVGFRFDTVWTSRDGGVADPPGVGLGGVFDTVPAQELDRRRSQARTTLRRRASLEAGGGLSRAELGKKT